MMIYGIKESTRAECRALAESGAVHAVHGDYDEYVEDGVLKIRRRTGGALRYLNIFANVIAWRRIV